MNLRALALGALIGFLFALTPSCGGGQADCDGCLDETGACVKARDVNLQACGTGGAACQACGAGQTCQGGMCLAQDAGPVTSTCREPCPDGCCDSTGACQTGRTAAACGSGGGACAACAQGQQCAQQGSTWSCQGKALGSACATDTECRAALGSTAFCKKQVSQGTAPYIGGYCSKPCSQSNPCGAGGICVPAGALGAYGEDDNFCMASCPQGNECRETEGYACYEFGSPQQSIPGCWLDPVPKRDGGAAAPAGVLGRPCTAHAQCGPPPDEAFCITAALPDGGPSGWTDGYCSTDCFNTANDKCGPDGVCFPGVDVCFDRCASAGSGQGDPADGGCRTAYVCRSYPLVNGSGQVVGRSTDGVCLPSCEAPGAGCGEGATCLTEGPSEGYCQLPDGGVAK